VPQVTEQLDEALQSMGLRQEPSAQCTEHRPEPHAIGVGQEPDPVHVMSQLDAFVQSTLPLHAFAPHVTRQGIPAGQTTAVTQLEDAEQSKTQTAPSQVPAVQLALHAVMAASVAAPSNTGGVVSVDESRAAPPPAPSPEAPPALASTPEAPPLVVPPEGAPSAPAAPPELTLPAEASRPPVELPTCSAASSSYPMRPHAAKTTARRKNRRTIAPGPGRGPPCTVYGRIG